MTIAPVYNGNFEMVPIQSLLSRTPVITYMQPFMEVVGHPPLLVANIEGLGAVEGAAHRWPSGDPFPALLLASRRARSDGVSLGSFSEVEGPLD